MRYWPFVLVLGIVFIGCAMVYESDDSDAANVYWNATVGQYFYQENSTWFDYVDATNEIQPLAGLSINVGNDGQGDYIIISGTPQVAGTYIAYAYVFDEETGDEGEIYYNVTVTNSSFTVSVYSAGGGTVSGGGTYNNGSTATITATPNTGYHFTNWSDGNTSNPRSFTVTGNVSLTAYFAINTYTVAWNNWDGTRLETDNNVAYGSTPSYNSATPTKPATAQYTYTFTGWSPAISTVTGNATYTAQFSSTVNTYTVIWNDWNGTMLETDSNVPYGSTPSYNGNTPTRPSTSQYSYTFSGWSPAIGTVTGNTTYTAQYTELALHTVVWKNWDGTVLETDSNVPEGTLPTYDGTTPTRPETSEYRYSFDGWSPTVVPVTTDAEYTAQFTTTSLFTVIWRNWNGTVLETDVSVPEGTTPTYNGSTPTRADTESFTYEFSGWSPAVGPISGYTEYTAQFTATALYLVTWLNWDGAVLDTDKVPEGTTPVYNGATPTRTMSVQYVYTFTGWSPTIVPITEDSEYTAQFSHTYREYTDGEWAYGILDSGYAILLDYTGSGGVVQIPVTVGGMTVSNIGVALKDNETVTGIVIPSNIKSIVYDAFSGTSITEVLNLSELHITGISYGLDGATIHTSIPGWFYISDVEYTDRVPDNSSVSKLIRIIPLLILIGVIVMIARNRVEDE